MARHQKPDLGNAIFTLKCFKFSQSFVACFFFPEKPQTTHFMKFFVEILQKLYIKSSPNSRFACVVIWQCVLCGEPNNSKWRAVYINSFFSFVVRNCLALLEDFCGSSNVSKDSNIKGVQIMAFLSPHIRVSTAAPGFPAGVHLPTPTSLRVRGNDV